MSALSRVPFRIVQHRWRRVGPPVRCPYPAAEPGVAVAGSMMSKEV